MKSVTVLTSCFKKYLHFLLLILILPIGLYAQDQNSVAGDRQALVDLYNSTNGDQWNNNTGWLDGNPSNSWFGVGVNDEGRVIALKLFKNNLNGTLPESIGNLKKLEFINIKHNKLRGQIPASIGNLESVVYLLLSGAAHNDQGDNPTGVPTGAHYPTKEDWGGNTFTGFIPPGIGNLPKVEYLDLSRNDFSGTSIPSEIGNLTTLKGLYLNSNNFTGQLPESFGNLINLIDLQLYAGTHDYHYNDTFPEDNPAFDRLTGTIPSSWGNMNSLQRLRLRDHKITGGFPNGWKNNDWWYFNVANNEFDEFPLFFGEGTFPKLSSLFIDNNNMSGELPEVFGNMNLSSIKLNDNNFTGKIPQSIWGMTKMIGLNLYNNNFEGTIPDDLSHLVNVRNIRISGNKLSGSLPTKLPDSRDLVSLSFSDNNFTGPIPESFGKIQSDLGLKVIWLSTNNLSGEVPSSLADLPNDIILAIDDNKFVPEDLLPASQSIDLNIDDFRYKSQKFGDDITIQRPVGEEVTLEFGELSHTGNQYQWKKDGQNIASATSRTLQISSMSTEDEGSYTLAVTNTLLPELNLNSNAITLKVGVASEIPSLSSPSDNTENVSTTPTFEWGAVDTDHYILQVRNSGSSEIVIETDVNGTTLTLSEDLAAKTTYKWRVKAVKDGVEGSWSSEWEFTTESGDGGDNGGNLDAPIQVFPENSEEEVSLNPTLKWSDVGADYYVVHLDTPGSTSLIVDAEVNGTEYSVNKTLDTGRVYKWRVHGVKNGTAGEWSPIWEFTTKKEVGSAGPESPSLKSPANNVNDLSLTPTLNWDAVDAGYYTLQVKIDSSSETVLERDLQSPSFTFEEDLLKEKTYSWRVRAVKDGLQSDWSSSWSFTTGNNGGDEDSIEIPALNYPNNQVEDIALTPTFRWNSVDADHYILQVNNSKSSETIIEVVVTGTSFTLSDELDPETVYDWRVRAVKNGVNGNWSSNWSFTTGLGKEIQTTLNQNYPNPFNPSTQIRFTLGETQDVSLKVYDTVGRLVATLVEGRLTAGVYERTFRADNLASGVYFIRFITENRILNSQMTLMK